MADTKKSHHELKRAKKALGAFGAASSLDEAEDAWLELLSRIERCWFKLQPVLQQGGPFQAIRSESGRLRKRDPLLAYMQQARHADEHGIADVSERRARSVTFDPLEKGGRVVIHSMRTDETGMPKDIVAGPAKITFRPARLELVPVTNRGCTSEVPAEHLGSALSATTAAVVGGEAVNYYEGLLRDVDGINDGA